jgi:hypothetical protein
MGAIRDAQIEHTKRNVLQAANNDFEAVTEAVLAMVEASTSSKAEAEKLMREITGQLMEEVSSDAADYRWRQREPELAERRRRQQEEENNFPF